MQLEETSEGKYINIKGKKKKIVIKKNGDISGEMMPAERKSSPYRNSWSHFTTGKVQGSNVES